MNRFSYARRPYASLVGQDALLVLVFATLLVWSPDGKLGTFASLLRGAIPLVLGWGVLTLHFPCDVEMDDRTLTFRRYGRRHCFDLHRIESIHVRRFRVRDRVLVRIIPAPPWQGRYWLMRDLNGFDDLLRRLEGVTRERELQEDGNTGR